MKIKLLDYKKLKPRPAPVENFLAFDEASEGLDIFKDRLRSAGIGHLNISGSVLIEDYLVLCNQAKDDSINHMIITTPEFRNDQLNVMLSVLPVHLPDDDKFRVAISGIIYSPKNDWLVFSAIKENSGPDKESVKPGSYIGVIENAARKIGRKKMKVNSLTELSTIEKKFKGFTAAGLSLQSDKSEKIKANVLADNDKNIAHLLHIRIKQ